MHNIKHNKKRSCSELWVLWTRLFWTQAQAVFAEQPNGYLYIWIYFSHFCIFGHNDFCIWLPTSTLARRSNGCVVSHQDQRPKVGSFQITWLSLLLAISSSSSSNPQASNQFKLKRPAQEIDKGLRRAGRPSGIADGVVKRWAVYFAFSRMKTSIWQFVEHPPCVRLAEC
jgi:hypothetical protein